MNAPDRYEIYTLGEDEKLVEVTEDTKIPNAATIKIAKQDHTLGNMLRGQLLAMPQVLFAGYKVPHPLQPYFIIKLQTDGTATPAQVLEQACNKLLQLIINLKDKFAREFQDRGIDGGVALNLDDPYGDAHGTGWGTGREYADF